MTRFGLYLLFFAFCITLRAQNNSIANKLEEVTYPRLPRLAGIHGDVRVRLTSSRDVELVSGHPLLAPAVIKSLADIVRLSELGDIPNAKIEIVYHFILVEPDIRTTTTTMKKGDSFDRFILRLLMMKTEKTVKSSECLEKVDRPENRVDSTRPLIEVWIYDAIPCANAEASYIASR